MDLLQDPVTGLVVRDTTVEVGVSVSGNVVGQFTQTWVVDDGNESVYRDDWTGVTSSTQGRSTLGKVTGNLVDGGLTVVDQLVTDGDGVDIVPRTVGRDGSAHGLDTGLDLVDKEDTQEQFLVGLFGLQDVRDLVTVDTVQSDDLELGQPAQVGLNLGQRFTSTGSGVRRVSDTFGTSSEVGLLSWSSTDRGGGGEGQRGARGGWDSDDGGGTGVGGKGIDINTGGGGWWSLVVTPNGDQSGLGDNLDSTFGMFVVNVLDWRSHGGADGQGSNDGTELHGEINISLINEGVGQLNKV